MRRSLRILGYAGLSVVGVIVVACGVVYAISESRVRRGYAVPVHEIRVPSDTASVAEGKRLAAIRGCTGCHGTLAGGDTFIDDWRIARVISPDLTQSLQRYSNAQLAGIIRHGVRPDGKSVVVMPSGMFQGLTDEDLGRILAFLRSLPVSDGPGPSIRLGPLARVMFTLEKFLPAAVEADSAARLRAMYPVEPDPNARGGYLARTVCTECHGLDLKGDPSGKPPDLRIAASYPLDAFTHLMRTGLAPGERDLGLMTRVARWRFSHFTDDEIRALHRYLVARAR
jgi:mono/diheme cytochrome c family protein